MKKILGVIFFLLTVNLFAGGELKNSTVYIKAVSFENSRLNITAENGIQFRWYFNSDMYRLSLAKGYQANALTALTTGSRISFWYSTRDTNYGPENVIIAVNLLKT